MTSKLLALVVGASVGMFPGPREDSIAAAIEAWNPSWPWGVSAGQFSGDELDDLCITNHNGGSIILENLGNGQWKWVDVGSNLGGTFRPHVFDFNGDGLADLAFRDSTPNTFYKRHSDGESDSFSAINFGYGTSNHPIRYVGSNYFGTDWLRYTWTGSTYQYQEYINPNFWKLPLPFMAQIAADLDDSFFRAWFNESSDLIAVSGFWSYWEADPYCRFFWKRRNQLIEVGAKLGLPTTGAVCHSQDFNGDGKTDFLIVGHGYYVSGPNGYTKKPGALTDFLAPIGAACHQVFVADDVLVVSNVRSLATKLFQLPGMAQIEETGSWEEGACVGDFNGDGVADVAIGSGSTVKFYMGQ